MYLLGLIKLFEQKGLLITLVNMLIAQFGLKKKNPVNPICAELVLWSKDKILNYGDYFKRRAIVVTIAGYFSTYKVTESWKWVVSEQYHRG